MLRRAAGNDRWTQLGAAPLWGITCKRADGTFSALAYRLLIRTMPQSHYHFLSKQLLVDTIHFCYTLAVTRKRLNSLHDSQNRKRIFVVSVLDNRTHDDPSRFPAIR